MDSWRSGRSSCARSTAISSCHRSSRRNGRKSREEVKSSTVQQVGYATLAISTRFGTGPRPAMKKALFALTTLIAMIFTARGLRADHDTHDRHAIVRAALPPGAIEHIMVI